LPFFLLRDSSGLLRITILRLIRKNLARFNPHTRATSCAPCARDKHEVGVRETRAICLNNISRLFEHVFKFKGLIDPSKAMRALPYVRAREGLCCQGPTSDHRVAGLRSSGRKVLCRSAMDKTSLPVCSQIGDRYAYTHNLICKS
jgi:hypothetical protein